MKSWLDTKKPIIGICIVYVDHFLWLNIKNIEIVDNDYYVYTRIVSNYVDIHILYTYVFLCSNIPFY